MAPKAQPALSLSRLNDTILGGVGSAIPPSQTLDHILRYIGTWSGQDKFLMTAQYGAKLLVPLLELRAQLQHNAGRRAKPFSPSSAGLSKLAGTISAARRVSGLWGILSIVKWVSAMERTNPSSRTQLTIERLQGLSMLVFYTLENISFFSSPSAPLLANRISPSLVAKAQLWSIRAWAAYVVLQLLHLRNDWTAVLRKEKTIRKAEKMKEGDGEEEVANVKAQKSAILNDLVVNFAFLPLTVHWSRVGGIFNNEIWVDVLSFIAAVGSFRAGWTATAL